MLLVNRSRLGPQGPHRDPDFRLDKGSILFDQERFNELQLYLTRDRPTETQGFRTILAAPHHSPTTASSRRPATASASTTSRSSSATSC